MSASVLSSWSAGIYPTGYYVVGVVNPNAGGGVSYYALNESTFAQFMSYMFSDSILDSDAEISITIQKELVNPFQYVQKN